MNAPDKLFILGRQVELINRNQTLGQIVTIMIASSLCWVGYQEGVVPYLVGLWGLAAIGMALLRLALARKYAQSPVEERAENILAWHRKIRLGALGSGLIWSVGTMLMMSGGNLPMQLFTAFAMAGISAGALPVLGADRWAYRLFAWPIILTVIFSVFATDHMHAAFSALASLALIIFTRSADAFHRMLNETFELEREKTRLLSTVDQARQTAEKSDLAKTQFLANVSHELRTPMNGILGLSELLSSDPLTPDQAELLSLLRDTADGLMRQIDLLIELSALEAGHVVIKPAPFAVADLLEGLVSSQLRSANEKGLKLEKQADPDLPLVLIGDLERLREIFDHLVGNAIKFTEHGTISITAKLLEKQNQHARIAFSIRDTGPGISEEKLQVIKGLFAPGDSSLIRRHSGIGIGLPISRKLVELMGGEISIASEVGVGSNFCFTLPFALEVAPVAGCH